MAIVSKYYGMIRSWHVVYVCMIATGILYPFYDQYTIPQMLLRLGEFPFYTWCLLMVGCGIGGFIRPNLILLWLSPVLGYLVATAALAFEHVTLTAIIYYSALWLSPVYNWCREHGESTRLHRLHLTQAIGVLLLLMGLVLIGDPDGAGMGLLYNALGYWVGGFIDPVLLYQMTYICFGIVLLFPVDYNRYVVQIATLPFVIHGVAFLSVIIFNTRAWAFVPPFLAVTWLYLDIGGRRYDG